MPRKFTLSPAKVNTYLTCRQMYYNNYITRINRYYYKKNIGDSFGGSIHRALDKFYKADGLEIKDITAYLQDTWSNAGYKDTQEEQAYRAKAEELLKNYYDKNIGHNVISTEKTLKKDMGDYNLTGRIDRIDRISETHIRLVDYKSGRMNITTEELKANMAMQIYSLLAKNEYRTNDVSTGIYCIQTGNESYVSFDENEEKNTLSILDEAAKSMMAMDADSIVIPNFVENICPYCMYYDLCKKNF